MPRAGGARSRERLLPVLLTHLHTTERCIMLTALQQDAAAFDMEIWTWPVIHASSIAFVQ